MEIINIIKNGSFNFASFKDVASAKANSKEPGVYLLLYTNIGNGSNAWYVGSSGRLGQRFRNHKGKIESQNTPKKAVKHYGIARKAESWKMITLASFNLDPMPRYLLCVAEQIFESLFHSWNPEIFSLMTPITSTLRQIADAALIARTFSALAKEVFVESGWTVPVAHGCNWTTPLVEIVPDRSAFTLQQDANIRLYRRSPVKVLDAHQSKCHLFGGDTSSIKRDGELRTNCRLTIPKQHGIRQGMYVFVICEITRDGRAHEAPYLRLPDYGPFTDWAAAKSLG